MGGVYVPRSPTTGVLYGVVRGTGATSPRRFATGPTASGCLGAVREVFGAARVRRGRVPEVPGDGCAAFLVRATRRIPVGATATVRDSAKKVALPPQIAEEG